MDNILITILAIAIVGGIIWFIIKQSNSTPMSLKSFLAKIGSIFSGLFNSAKKTFNKLTPEQKEALKQGSGIIAIVNSMLDKSPAQVRAAISKQFPNLPTPLLEKALFEAAHAYNLLPGTNSMEDVIKALQSHLNATNGKAWANISHGIAGLLSIIFAPAGTKFAVVSQLLEFVYQTFFKKENNSAT